jgi:hypothetical protein
MHVGKLGIQANMIRAACIKAWRPFADPGSMATKRVGRGQAGNTSKPRQMPAQTLLQKQLRYRSEQSVKRFHRTLQ